MTGVWAALAGASDVDARSRAALASRWASCGGVLVATCHRVELYGTAGGPPGDAPRLVRGEAAVAHLLAVGAGLDSAVPAETEVLGQVRQAILRARLTGAVDPVLDRLFDTAIRVGRLARAARPRLAPSLADQAIGWLHGMRTLDRRDVLVVGSGTMGRSLARAASQKGAYVTVAGRDSLGAAALAAPRSAGVAVALRGPWPELEAVEVPLPPIADVSSPPAVSVSIRARASAFLGIDDLYRRPGRTTEWAAAAQRLVRESTGGYLAWLDARASAATMRGLREAVEGRRRARLARALRRMPDLDERERRLVEQLSVQLAADFVDLPLRNIAGDEKAAAAARILFSL
jgi:glutamyl-tRNA reductase